MQEILRKVEVHAVSIGACDPWLWALLFPMCGMRGGPNMHVPCVNQSYLFFRKPCHRQRSWDP